MSERAASGGDEISTDLLPRRALTGLLLFVASICVVLLAAAPFLSARPATLMAIYAGVAMACLVARQLATSGRANWAVVVFVVSGWLTVTASAALLGGVRSPSFSAYISVVLLAGLLWSERAALVVGALSAAAATGFALAPSAWLPDPLVPLTAWRHAAAVLAQVALTLLALRLAMRSLQRNLASARENAAIALAAKRDTEHRMRQQAAIARLGARALASRDTRALLDECVAEIARTLDAELVKVLELTPDGSQLLLRTGIGWNLGLVGKERVPSGTNSQAGFTLSSKVPVLVDDLPSERRFAGPDLLTSHGVRSGVSVVIRSDEGAFGILAAHSRKPSFFHGEDALFLQTAANLLGEALSRERLEARLARQGRLEALGRLAGGVAHDFNNLLTVILAYADALSENSASVDAPSAAKEIRNAAERAAALTRELLAFSRREPGTPTTLDLNEVVPRILRMLRRLVGEDVQLRTSWSPEPCPVLADASQIERVLMNLVVNARDAQPGGGEIAIETRREVRAGRPLVKLVVSDRGPGMPAHVLAHAFEPFFTTKTNGTGSGLGLATVYGLVSQLGGQVLMSSEVGAGTRIEVELPMAAETPVASSASPPNDVAMDTRGSGETILLAEDDDELRGLLRSALEQSGYVVWQAHDGRAALAIVESQPGAIDALVTDVVMPGASGLDVVARLRELSPGAGVLYTSGFLGDEGDLSELQREDVVFLRKPFRTSELEAALRKALARRVAPTAAAAKMLAPHAV